uniref:Major facilitator superfamily (MFS) profile domain-containing protein n=1 Tax=Arion vulgaris TaxID=1028688 RepID=A0A0B6ZNU6_9EUPU
MVTAIIDGTGSIGAAIGPLLTGVISSSSSTQGWNYVFYMLIAADLIAALLLGRVVKKEFQMKFHGGEDDITIIIPKDVQRTSESN